MDQRAALLWDHDHVMGVTKLSVYSGLAGLVDRARRARARARAAEGPPFEVPLLLQDRNFGEDEDGNLTGELVHKTDPGTMVAFAPFTTVNGKGLAVPRRVIGHLPAAGHQRLELAHLQARAAPRRKTRARSHLPDRDRRRPARGAGGRPLSGAGARLGRARRPPRADQLAGATQRTVVLVEQELGGVTNMLTMRELVAVAHDGDTGGPLLTIVDPTARAARRPRACVWPPPTSRTPDLLPDARRMGGLAACQTSAATHTRSTQLGPQGEGPRRRS